MSKKINLFFLLISCLLFTSFSPSLDGRAVVADPGVLPEGYFAKTVGYLPGDSIIVSNFAAGKTLDILVVGSLDQSEGVAILLSPEAAAELGIVKDSNVIVKITKRSGELDEAVSGTAVIAQGETLLSAEENTESAAADSGVKGTDSAESEDKSGEETPPVSGDETLISESADDAAPAEADVQNDESEVDKAGSDDAEAISDERVTDEPVVTEAEGEEGERIAEKTDAQEEASDEGEAVPETIGATEEEALPDEKVIAEDVPEDVREKSEAAAEDIPAESEAISDERVTDEPVVTEAESDEMPAEAEERVSSESVPSAEAADEKIADVPPEEERDIAGDTLPESDKAPEDEKGRAEKLIAEPVESAPPADDNSYKAIVLTDADDSESKTESAAEASAETRTTESVQAESVSESDVSAAQSTVSPSRGLETAASIAREYGVRTAENLSSLDKGTYYVQIAAFSAPSNIRETLGKYGRDYPVTLVPLASGGATQVMIGPLSVDEYAVVLERFKLYGYKDAFVRKIR